MAGAESFLQYRYRNSTLPPAVFSNTNGVLEQVGNNFGVDWDSELFGTQRTLRHHNLVVEWEGELYAVGISGTNQLAVFKYNPATGDWAQDSGDLLNLNSTAQVASNLGLHPIEVDGIPYLYFIYNGADSNNRTWTHVRKQSRFRGDGSWSAALSQTLTDDTADSETDDRGVCGDILIDDNKLYTSFVRSQFAHNPVSSRAGAIGVLSIFNFNTRVWSKFEQAGASGYSNSDVGGASLVGPMAMTKFKGKVYQLAREGVPEDLTGTFNGTSIIINSFAEGIIGGKLELELIGDMEEIESSAHDFLGEQDWGEGRYCMFVDRSLDKMYAIAYIRGSGSQGATGAGGQPEDGWACWQLDQDSNGDLVNEGEISHTVLPASVRAGISTRVGNPAQSLRWTSYDIVDASGATEILIELAAGGDTSDLVNSYRWRGPTQEIEYLGQGGGGDFSIPLINAGGGEGLWSERHPFDVVVGVDPSGGQGPGEVTLTARVIGSGEIIDVRWWYAAESGDIPNLVCTIKDASSGVITSNVLENVVADSGIQYSVIWEAETDGIPNNSQFAVKCAAVVA